MAVMSYVRYLFGSLPVLGLRGVPGAGGVLLVPAPVLPYLALLYRWSGVLGGHWLVEMGGYEVSSWGRGGLMVGVVWYLFQGLGGGVTLALVPVKGGLGSVEGYFRNARWLEREVGEAIGVFFKAKRDRRVLFLISGFYRSPMRRFFPVSGFYELGVCPWTHKLVFWGLALRS
jgi:hypothetical protein